MGDFLLKTTGVADKLVAIGMERKGEKTVRTEELVAAIFADAKR